MYSNKFISSIVLCSLFLLISCYKESDYIYSSDDILKELTVDIPLNSIAADGNSILTISYEFPVESDPEQTQLLITTDNGTFVESDNDTLETNFILLNEQKDKKVLNATLKASTSPGTVTIRTKLLNYEDIRTVNFNEAPTTKIGLNSSPFFFKNDTIQEIALSASVGSATGIASKGKNVTFNVAPNVGFFQSNSASSGSNGLANTSYIFTDTSYVGTLKFTAKTLNTNGDTLVSISELRVLD